MEREIIDFEKSTKVIIELESIEYLGKKTRTEGVKDLKMDSQGFLRIDENTNLYIELALEEDLKHFSNIKNSLCEEKYERLDLNTIKLVSIKFYGDDFIKFTYTFNDFCEITFKHYERLMVGSLNNVCKGLRDEYIISPAGPRICW